MRIWNVDGKDRGSWLYDLTSTLRCATRDPVKLPKYHYGGLAIRGGRSWYGDQCRFLTSEGTTRADGNHTRSRWCDMAGAADTSKDLWAGVTVMTHPGNQGFPEPVRIHPKMPYMCFNASQVGPWKIEPGTSVVLRYRFMVHNGVVKPQAVERGWHAFAKPPRVRILP